MRSLHYELILSRMAGSDERAVYAVLVSHVGAENRITREQLSRKVFGKYNASVDRTVRKHISNMRMNGRLICSDSGGSGGYYLPETIAEVDNLITELESRANRLYEESRMMRRTAIEQFTDNPQIRMSYD